MYSIVGAAAAKFPPKLPQRLFYVHILTSWARAYSTGAGVADDSESQGTELKFVHLRTLEESISYASVGHVLLFC